MKCNKTQIILFCLTAVSLFLFSAPGVFGNGGVPFKRKVVQFQKHVTWGEVEAFADEWREMGGDVVMRLPLINGLVLLLPDTVDMEDIAYDIRVAGVEGDQRLRLEEDMNGQTGSFIRPASNIADGMSPWGRLKLYDLPHFSLLDELVEEDIPGNIAGALDKLNRETVRIAVFDTGISTRGALTKMVKGGVDIVRMDPSGFYTRKKALNAGSDDNGHGTHVAGIIASALDEKFKWKKRSKFRKKGIELYSVKILDRHATGDLTNIIMGLQWAIDNGIDIVNMSIGYKSDSPAVRFAIEEAYRAGLIMVASSGNRSNYDDGVLLNGLGEGGAGEGGAGEGGAGEGGAGEGQGNEDSDSCVALVNASDSDLDDDEGCPGDSSQNPMPDYLPTMYPARYPQVIAVGASSILGEIAGFSNLDYKTDLLAPGEEILSVDITNGRLSGGFGYCSGTSMSTPFVTAAVAMLLAEEPMLGPEEIRRRLIDGANRLDGNLVGELNLLKSLSKFNVETLYTSHGDRYYSYEARSEYRRQIMDRIRNAYDD